MVSQKTFDRFHNIISNDVKRFHGESKGLVHSSGRSTRPSVHCLLVLALTTALMQIVLTRARLTMPVMRALSERFNYIILLLTNIFLKETFNADNPLFVTTDASF